MSAPTGLETFTAGLEPKTVKILISAGLEFFTSLAERFEVYGDPTQPTVYAPVYRTLVRPPASSPGTVLLSPHPCHFSNQGLYPWQLAGHWIESDKYADNGCVGCPADSLHTRSPGVRVRILRAAGPVREVPPVVVRGAQAAGA